MTKQISWICGISCAAILILYISCTSGNSQNSTGVQLIVFRSGNGWGYQIEKNHKTYISQPFIPVIQGKRPFPTFVSARNIGQKVIGKLLSNQIPMVTRQELISEGINCNSAF